MGAVEEQKRQGVRSLDTAGEVVTDALKELVAIPAEVPPASYEVTTGLLYLNLMMADFSINGINLGYTLVDSVADPVTVDDAALEPIVKNLAIELAPVFNTSIDGDIFSQAEEGMDILRNLSIETSFSWFSSNVPIGSGSYDIRYNRFFDEINNEILSEAGGNIAPESNES